MNPSEVAVPIFSCLGPSPIPEPPRTPPRPALREVMAPRNEKSQLKRQRVSLPLICQCPWAFHRSRAHQTTQGSLPEGETDSKKPRRSDRLSATGPDKTPVSHKQQLPSPLTNLANEESSEIYKEPTATPPGGRPDQVTPRKTDEAFFHSQALSSPPQDTQPLSQYVDRHPALSDEVEDEAKEGVWGYLVPLDPKYGDKPLVLKKRTACPASDSVAKAGKEEPPVANDDRAVALRDEEAYERTKVKGVASGGYLIGRHPECGELRNELSVRAM